MSKAVARSKAQTMHHLHVVLAEGAVAGVVRLAQHRNRLGLAHGHHANLQTSGGRVIPSTLRGLKVPARTGRHWRCGAAGRAKRDRSTRRRPAAAGKMADSPAFEHATTINQHGGQIMDGLHLTHVSELSRVSCKTRHEQREREEKGLRGRRGHAWQGELRPQRTGGPLPRFAVAAATRSSTALRARATFLSTAVILKPARSVPPACLAHAAERLRNAVRETRTRRVGQLLPTKLPVARRCMPFWVEQPGRKGARRVRARGRGVRPEPLARRSSELLRPLARCNHHYSALAAAPLWTQLFSNRERIVWSPPRILTSGRQLCPPQLLGASRDPPPPATIPPRRADESLHARALVGRW